MNKIVIFFRGFLVALLGANFGSDKFQFENLLLKFRKTPRYKRQTFRFKKFTFTVPDALSVIWQIKDYFVDGNYCFKVNTDSPVIYDCGANIGVASVYFKSIFPRAKIKAFEADLEIAGYFRENLLKNKMFDNVEIISKAVWIHEHGVSFGKEGADSGSLFNLNNQTKVESIRLKGMIDEEVRIDFLKMDIEGAEVEVIRDCDNVLGKIKYLFIEYHFLKGKKQELDVVLHILTKGGFKYFINQTQVIEHPYLNYDKTEIVNCHINIFAINEGIV